MKNLLTYEVTVNFYQGRNGNIFSEKKFAPIAAESEQMAMIYVCNFLHCEEFHNFEIKEVRCLV